MLPHTLVEGDLISATASHQIYIDGDQTWITIKVGGKVQEGEETHDAMLRIVDTVSGGVRLAVKETVENIRRIGAGEEE